MFIVLPKIFVGTRELRKEGRGRLREGKEGKRRSVCVGGTGYEKGERSRKGARKRKENTQL